MCVIYFITYFVLYKCKPASIFSSLVLVYRYLYFCCVMWIVSADLQEYSCEFGSGKYFALCGLGGILSCGTTHTAVVPLDLVKCRIQVDPAKYGCLLYTSDAADE